MAEPSTPAPDSCLLTPMHFTEFWSIVERDHTIQNPSTPEKLRLLDDYCRVRDGLKVLDVGCGKGWLLREWARRWQIAGTGLEINPWFVAEARRLSAANGLDDRIAFLEGPALDFAPDPAGYDVVLCIGASFALGGFDAALDWMRSALRPGGVLAIGEPFANEVPFPEALRDEWGEFPRDLAATAGALAAHGLELSGLVVASPDDWDRYESPKWSAAREWAAEHADHPGRGELLRQVAADRERYLRWERRFLGWAIFVASAAG